MVRHWPHGSLDVCWYGMPLALTLTTNMAEIAEAAEERKSEKYQGSTCVHPSLLRLWKQLAQVASFQDAGSEGDRRTEIK